MKKFIKRFVCLTLSALTAVGLSGCFLTNNDDETPTKKTIFARAQELSTYLDKVPASYAEMKGETSATQEPISYNAGFANAPARAVAASVGTSVSEFNPTYRPNAWPLGVFSDSENYAMNDVDTTLEMTKEEVTYVKGFFQTFSSLNEWIGYPNKAFCLKYDKQDDCIGLEEYWYDHNDDNTFVYRTASLRLVKDDKIDFYFSTKIVDVAARKTSVAYDVEYVEDDYYCHNYYYAGESFSTITFIDLKTSPTQIFNSSAVLVEGYEGQPWRKEIVLDFDDGKKIVYQEATDLFSMNKPDYEPTQAIRAYGADGNILFEKFDWRFVVDLWQLDGWKSLQPRGGNWQNGCILRTQKGDLIFEDGAIIHSDNQKISLIAAPFFEDSCFRAKFEVSYVGDVTENTVANLKLALAEYGLSFKYNYEELFECYVNDGFDEMVERYQFDRFDYKGMNWDDFKSIITKLDDGRGESFMDSLSALNITPEADALSRKDESEAYTMLDMTFSGTFSVDWEHLTLTIENLSVTVQSSVLLEKGEEYKIVVALRSSHSSVELASAKSTYTDGDLTISLFKKGNVSLIENLEKNENYTLVAYISNANGLRCSKFFYPEIASTGESKKDMQEGNKNFRTTVRVRKGGLTVMKHER